MLSLLAAPAVRAQNVFEIVYGDVKNFVLDIGAVWTSPFRGEWSDYRTAGLVLGGAGVLVLVDKPVADWVRDHQHTALLEAFDPLREGYDPKIEKLATAPRLDQIPLALYGAGLLVGSRSLRDAATGCLAAHQAQATPRYYFYHLLGRERPWVVEGSERRAPDESIGRPGDHLHFNVPGVKTWYDNSLPGGHVTNIVSCVSYLNHRFDLGVAEPALWTLALGIGVARMADQRHWLSDTALGSVLGIALGKYLAERSLDRLREDEGPPGGAREERPMTPELVVAPGRDGTRVGWRIRF
ncbi:MAG TPA: phosphatase PAP2 family protein [Thermoanaerobaculia bacterium]|nr:phosphatase PAP2 family protein [Thermoanaerobaculia bacterium]